MMKETYEQMAWLTEWRAAQRQIFNEMGFPARGEEEWKYTSVSAIAEKQFAVTNAAEIATLDVENFRIPDTYSLVFINGHFQEQLSTQSSEFEICSLDSWFSTQTNVPKVLKIKSMQTAFGFLNGSHLQNGFYLNVKKNSQILKPIHCLLINTSYSETYMIHPRLIFNVEENSHLVLIEEHHGLKGAAYFNNVVTQIEAKKNSTLTYYKIQNESRQAFHIANTFINQDAGSQVKSTHFTFGAGLARDDIFNHLQGVNAQSELVGLYKVKGQQHCDQHLHVFHEAEATNSVQNYHGVINDSARAVFNGKIIVRNDAPKTKAKQLNKNLLLSKKAEIYTKPELQIYVDDVQCSHGATIGELNSEALFYLRSRGIPYEEAAQILIHAFTEEIIESIGQKNVKQHIQKLGDNYHDA